MSGNSYFKKLRKSGVFYRRVERARRRELEEEQAELAQTIDQPSTSSVPAPECLPAEFERGEDEQTRESTGSEGDSDDDSDSKLENMSVEECVRYWALSENAPHSSVKMILNIFRLKTDFKLPRDPRTLLRTPTGPLPIVSMGSGQFWYNGVAKSLAVSLRKVKLLLDELSLNVSVSGLPLDDSSAVQFWPMLFNVHEMPRLPVMVAAIFCGESKPASAEVYLRQFVDEMNTLVKDGVPINGKQVKIKLRVIIADTPARAFAKGVISFNGPHGCMLCTVEGYLHPEGRSMVFRGVTAPRRTDHDFRKGAYPDHCKAPTPLLDLQRFDIVRDVIVSDRLHLIDLGVMKWMLLGWRDGSFGSPKWSTEQCTRISSALQNVLLPAEIHRKLRPLKHARHWKGSEYSTFLHYASVVVLRDHLSEEQFKHFCLFFCSVTLLATDFYKPNWPLAGQLLDRFILQFGSLYGERYLTSHVHNLQHVAEEVQQFGALATLSSYPFENKLQQLKRLLRSGWTNLEQVVHRTAELDQSPIPLVSADRYPAVSRSGAIETLRISREFCLQNSPPNEWLLTKWDEIAKFIAAEENPESNSLGISARTLTSNSSLFDDPFESSNLYVFKVNATELSEHCVPIALNEIRCKLVAFQQTQEETIFIPLIHTLCL